MRSSRSRKAAEADEEAEAEEEEEDPYTYSGGGGGGGGGGCGIVGLACSQPSGGCSGCALYPSPPAPLVPPVPTPPSPSVLNIRSPCSAHAEEARMLTQTRTRISSSVDEDGGRIRSHQQQQQPYCPPFRIIVLALLTGLGGILFGYDLGVIAFALPGISKEFHLGSWEQEAVVSILYVGGGIGAGLGGVVADTHGRRSAILMVDVAFVVGATLLSFSYHFPQLLLGRFVVGFAVAVSGLADVAYLNEISPPDFRGSLVSVNEACISLGFLLSFVGGSFLSSTRWRVLFGLSGALAAVQFVGMVLWMPESPPWLEKQGRHAEALEAYRAIDPYGEGFQVAEAKAMRKEREGARDEVDSITSAEDEPGRNSSSSERRVRTGTTTAAAAVASAPPPPPSSSFASYYHAVDSVEQAGAATATSPDSQARRFSQPELGNNSRIADGCGVASFPSASCCPSFCGLAVEPLASFLGEASTRYRRQSWIALFLAATQQFCGQTNVLSYTHVILFGDDEDNNGSNSSNDGTDPDRSSWGALWVGTIKFVVTCAVIVRIEKTGRRFFLLAGMSALALGLVLLVVGSSSSSSITDDAGGSSSSMVLPGMLLVVCGYSMSFGPLTWLLTSELYPAEIRGRALGCSTIVTYLCAALVSATFLSARNVWGAPAVFGSYLAVTVAGIIFAHQAVPDTREKSSDEIDRELLAMPWWSSRLRVGSSGAEYDNPGDGSQHTSLWSAPFHDGSDYSRNPRRGLEAELPPIS